MGTEILSIGFEPLKKNRKAITICFLVMIDGLKRKCRFFCTSQKSPKVSAPKISIDYVDNCVTKNNYDIAKEIVGR